MHLSFIVNLGGNGSLLDFLTDIYRSYLLGEDVLDSEKENISPAEKVRSLEAGTVTNSVHFDKIGQWPVKSTANRCKMDGYSSRKLFICVWQKVERPTSSIFMEQNNVISIFITQYNTYYVLLTLEQNFAFWRIVSLFCPEFLMYT